MLLIIEPLELLEPFEPLEPHKQSFLRICCAKVTIIVENYGCYSRLLTKISYSLENDICLSQISTRQLAEQRKRKEYAATPSYLCISWFNSCKLLEHFELRPQTLAPQNARGCCDGA